MDETFDKKAFLSGIAVGRQMKGWSNANGQGGGGGEGGEGYFYYGGLAYHEGYVFDNVTMYYEITEG